MTWLLLDVGNTALKWRLAEPDDARLSPTGGAVKLSPDLAAELAGALRGTARPVEAAFGCNVADVAALDAVNAAVSAAFGVAPTWFGSQAAFVADGAQLVSGYRDPAQLGADRWHAMLAARAAHPGRALVIVNAGTATTVDCVDAGGRFVGGVIAPGVALMFESLARQTAQLPRARGAFVARPDNTDDAITTGVLDSQLGLIERRVRRLAAEAGPVLLLLDGGHAAALRPHLAFDPALATLREEPNLVLRGVLVRARAQRAAARG